MVDWRARQGIRSRHKHFAEDIIDPTTAAPAVLGGEQTIRLLTFDVDHAALQADTPFTDVFGMFLGDALTSSAFIGSGDVVAYSLEAWTGHPEIKLWVGAAVPANIGDTAGDFYARPLRVANASGPTTTSAALATNVIDIYPTSATYQPLKNTPASLPAGAQLYVYVVDNTEAGLGTVPSAGTERIWVRLSEPAA